MINKLFKTTLAALLAISMTACGSTASTNEEPQPTEAAVEEEGPRIVTASNGRAKGLIGDVMQARNLAFTVNSAHLTDAYQTVTPDYGMKLLVVNASVHNRQETSMTFYDTDFQVQWGGTAEEDYTTPITYRDEYMTNETYMTNVNLEGVTGMFDTENTIGADETKTADIVYQVPNGNSAFVVLFPEYFSDESLGDLFIVNFIAQLQ